MTIGEKIAKYRIRQGLSQEQLAEKTEVSRQSVSKWEIGHALPQLDKLSKICEVLGVSADEFLSNGSQNEEYGETKRNKYFGTDGFRGEANVGLTSIQAYKVGRFLGWYYSSQSKDGVKKRERARIVIGKDTRRSGYMLEYSIAAGITASGADVYMLHVTTTPSVSYVTRIDGFDCGIMITASHNPFYDNGIKIINRYGEKLDDLTTEKIEAYLDGDMSALGISASDLPLARGEKIGSITDYVAGRNRYIGYLISLASHSYKNLNIGIDCANGASWNIASAVFGALGARLTVIGDEPNGLNINKECGSTNIERLSKLVREHHLDLGFAFDGDADRCIAVDENGNVKDGDAIMFILARRLKMRGMLNGDRIAATVMSNSGFDKALGAYGITCERTSVGDRFVYELMQEKDISLGGEQSGHIIIKKYATTGDGILTAIMLCEEILDSKMLLSALTEQLQLYPQYVRNVRVFDKDAAVTDVGVTSALSEVESALLGRGRVLLRKSGTEPVIRIMIECESDNECKEYADKIYSALLDGGYVRG